MHLQESKTRVDGKYTRLLLLSTCLCKNLLKPLNLHIFFIMMYLRKYYFKHQDISSVLIISIFLLIFQN